MHVIDASSDGFEDKRKAVDALVDELGLSQTPQLLVLNKTDLCNEDELAGLVQRTGGLPVSALDRGTFGPLMRAIEASLWRSKAYVRTAPASRT